MGVRRTVTETINDILETQLDRLNDRSKSALLSSEEVAVLKMLADIWHNSRGRAHRGKDNYGPASKLDSDKLSKYAKG